MREGASSAEAGHKRLAGATPLAGAAGKGPTVRHRDGVGATAAGIACSTAARVMGTVYIGDALAVDD